MECIIIVRAACQRSGSEGLFGAQVLAPRVPTYYSTMRRWPIMIALGGECFNVTKTKSTLQSLAVHIPAFSLVKTLTT